MALPDWVATFVAPLERLGLTYMVTGSVGAMTYGEPRMTTDVDIVLELPPDKIESLLACFPEASFYRPPADVVRVEVHRSTRGHFNVIEHATGMKADFYPVGLDPLPNEALRRRTLLEIGGAAIAIAPPTYIIVRKLEFFREGGAEKHLRDIASMLAAGCPLDEAWLSEEVKARGLTDAWARVRGGE